MSSFIMSNQSLSVLAVTMCALEKDGGIAGRSIYCLSRPESLRGLSVEAVAVALRGLNERGVVARYGEGAVESFNVPWEFRDGLPVGAVRLHALVDCLLYQAAEGEVPEEVLYKELAAYAGSLACRIVRASPEYQAAPRS